MEVDDEKRTLLVLFIDVYVMSLNIVQFKLRLTNQAEQRSKRNAFVTLSG